MNAFMNLAKPVFTPLRAKQVKQIPKLKTAKVVKFEKVSAKTKNREKYIREKPKITAVELVQACCERRTSKNLAEICLKKARMMAQRKADRITKEMNNFF